MKKRHSLAYYIVIFVIVQLIWLSIAGLWISRFVINNVIHSQIGEAYAIKIPDGGAVAMLVIGLSLLVVALAGMSLLFRYLNVQFNLTRLYDSFIANITHELKTPIASIQLYLETMKKRNVDENQRNKFLENMEKDTEKLTNLINNVLVVSRLEQKVQIFDCNVIDLDSLFRKNIQKLNDEYGVDIQFQNEKENLKILFDENAFHHILKNLVENSIKYSKTTVQIGIRIVFAKKWILVYYQDNGIGISNANRRKVFRKFHRGDNKELPNVKGTGLGLFLVREILKYHKGKINIMKNSGEAGTLFCLKIRNYEYNVKKLNKIKGI